MTARQSFAQSCKNALKGIYRGIADHRNIKWMLLIALGVIVAGYIVVLSSSEWMAVIICISLVLTLELVNTAIEVILDHLHPERHDKIGLAKDIAAGAVLLACLLSGVVGLLILIPRLLLWIH